jgi:CheY-like chemotaxis protein
MSNDLANHSTKEIPSNPTGTAPKKLIIIEDDLFIRELYKGVFTESGYLVDLAIDGKEALEKINSQTYDMILLDLVLPKITGIDLLRICREPSSHAKNTPIFLITNLGQEKIIDEAFKLGCQGYLLKAKLLPAEIVSQVSKFLEGNH